MWGRDKAVKKTLSFEWGTEKQVKVSSAGHRDSLFYEAYRQAMAGVVEIVRASRLYTDSQDLFLERNNRENGKSESSYLPQADCYYYNYPSNMIVFSGERGTGKSSALLTFVDDLSCQGSGLFEREFLDDMVRHELPGLSLRQVERVLSDVRFVPATPIDPTKLEDGSHILAVILAKMFKIAADRWDEEDGAAVRRSYPQERLNEKNRLLEHFSQCYQHIIALKNIGDPKEFEALDILKELGDTVDLKREFADLVRELLDFCFPGRANTFLVLQIDDTDMNVRFAYKLLEDLRKYLVIPRMMIVMAADLEHLTKVVESEFLSGYNKKLQDIEDMAGNIATQYITKLFPQTRQIWLPSLKSYLKEQINQVSICCSVLNEQILPVGRTGRFDSQDEIFRLIYQKTGIIFLKREDHLHFIIPDNMRDLSHFLAVLAQMRSVANPDEKRPDFFLPNIEDIIAGKQSSVVRQHSAKLQARLQNVQRFRDYFLHGWAINNLSAEHIKILSVLHQTSFGSKIKFIWENLKSNSKTDSQAVSYAGLMDMLHQYERSADEEKMKFGFAIRNYFSFLAHCIVLEDLKQFYDELADFCEAGSEFQDPREQTKEDLLGAGISGAETRHGSQEDYQIKKWGVEFRRLRSIFGSHLFPETIPNNQQTIPETTGLKWPMNDGGEEQTGYICCHWNPDLCFAKDLKKDRLVLNTLYTLFLDDKPLESGSLIEADLTSYIPNSLYYSPHEPVSTLVKDRFTGTASLIDSFATGKSDIKPESAWQEAQSMSLLVALNADVQQAISRTLQDKVKWEDSSEYKKNDPSLVDLDTGILLMQEFLQEIGEGFNAPHLDDEEKGTEQPIRCLGELSFPKWFGASYHSKKLEADTQNENGPRGTTRFFLGKLKKNKA